MRVIVSTTNGFSVKVTLKHENGKKGGKLKAKIGGNTVIGSTCFKTKSSPTVFFKTGCSGWGANPGAKVQYSSLSVLLGMHLPG
jgi:hypothetical protein